MKVSVIYNTFNRWEQLDHGLTSLLSKETKPDEIIIVDDGSTDGTQDKIMAKYMNNDPLITYIYIPYKDGKTSSNISCHGKNVGIKAATGDVLCFSDPEIIHPDDTLGTLLKELNDNVPIATQIWTVGQRIYQKLTQDNFDRPATVLYHEYAQLTDAQHPNNTKAPDSDFAITGSNNCFAGCFFICTKKAMLEAGGFDEKLTGYGWEDWDMFHRLEKLGHPLKYINIPIIHLWHAKNYDFNIYEAGNRNGKISERNIRKGKYVANMDNPTWGVLK